MRNIRFRIRQAASTTSLMSLLCPIPSTLTKDKDGRNGRILMHLTASEHSGKEKPFTALLGKMFRGVSHSALGRRLPTDTPLTVPFCCHLFTTQTLKMSRALVTGGVAAFLLVSADVVSLVVNFQDHSPFERAEDHKIV
ncbi:unnamed protein product [Cyprideis torosa]|uniref:Uncharacterized protein n=1 Tax=Cyprideis torosa TaxID=163714 RepID=A0A7R8ZL23_9CRUS|nr:unnamed protein product [Cyprideis torosa]CAG0892380.1 unnamed protein product [Cyprideis torosa]